jgi:acetyl esterase/lipase
MGGKKSSSKASRNQKNQKLHHWIWRSHPRMWKVLGWVFGILAALALVIYIAFQVSPWPNSLLIRYEFTKGGERTSKALEPFVPNNIVSVDNQVYRANDANGRLDVFYPKGTDKQLPTIVWTHGGGWVSGDKDEVDNYLKILAAKGFTTVGVDYTIAPEAQYPTPLFELNDALKYIQDNAERLNIDPNKIILAGDSAGSQITAQVANAITSPDYANKLGMQPTLEASKLRAVLLNCGAYDLKLPNYNGPFGDFLRTVLWAYSGTKDFMNDPKLQTASVVNYITPAFPPAFMTAGNVDPLLAQSTEFAKKLDALKVPTSQLFYPADHQPQLNHEYQFDLDTSDGLKALNQMAEFAKQRTE